jgi:hypothetical protein
VQEIPFVHLVLPHFVDEAKRAQVLRAVGG